MTLRRLFVCSSVALLFSAALFGISTPVHAQVDTGLAEVGETVKLSATDPRVIATNIINVALGLVGIVLVSLIIYGGFLYMTSGGDETKVEKAKSTIRNAIIGLILILSSWAIARFVITKLLGATQDGGGVSSGPSFGAGGGFAGSGVSNVFQVKGINPQGSVPIRNVQVKMLFTRPVDDGSVTAIVVTKNGGTTVGGNITVDGSLVVFTPADPCPAPNQTLKCFDGDSEYTVQIGGGLRSATGQTIVCGGFAPSCTAVFRTGNLIDIQPPTAVMTEPLDGQGVPADSLVTLRAMATDDSGVAYMTFFDGANAIDQASPNASTTPVSFDGEVQWDTVGIPLQSIRQISARAFDIDAHDTQSASIGVVIRGPSCFNGVQDGEENAIDCGGTPNTPGFCGACSGGACTANTQCASGVCQAGSCVEQPTITGMTPLDGRPGTFVTITGANFGTAGAVVFLGGAGDGDDRVASAPASCTQGGMATWSSTQVTVSVPDGAVIGPVKITNTASSLSDATNDGRGPKLPDFVINDAAYPGLCALNPAQGFSGTQFTLIGQGFGTSPSAVSFGSSNITSFSSWTDGQIIANVPVVGVGKHAVSVKSGTTSSNTVDFNVLNKTTAGPPTVGSIDPAQGPRGEYVTLMGTNFGYTIGTVRFRSKTSQQEALGSTAFPAACAAGYWTETAVVIKVPQEFLAGGEIVPGDYAVRIIRSDAAESNTVNFSVTTGNAKPGICAVTPSVGPVGTKVSIVGERFGADTGNVTFYEEKAAIAASWANGEIQASVPAGAVTGPVTINAQGVKSNAVNFQVRNCNEQPGICSLNEQCCGNGTCMPLTQSCGVVSQSAMFAWQSSTGLIPVAPRVVEECAPTAVPAPIPSPSPWNARAGGNEACINSTIVTRFTTHLDATTVTQANFTLKKCTAGGTDPCSASQGVALAPGFPALQPASVDQDLVRLQPKGNLDPDSTYLVEVSAAVKGAGISGTTMDPNPGCGNGVGYCFRFKTRSSTALCSIGAVSVSPHPFELNNSGATVGYLASPISTDDACAVLQCESYNWNWEHGDNNADGRAIFDTPLKVDPATGNISCRQLGVAITETGNVPVSMNAIALPDNVKGTGHLFVKFIPPRVQDFAPNCNLACTNAMVWARFSVAIDPNSIVGNIVVRPCANENCIETELGVPLSIPSDAITLTTVPKTAETDARFLAIRKGTLLIPGKYYVVLLKGGTDQGIKGLNGVPMTGLNHPDGFMWKFRTKLGDDAFCTAETVDIAPFEKYETAVGARQLFNATAFGKPDECSATGQALVQTGDTKWATSDAKIASFIGSGAIDTGAALPPQCSAVCLALGSQAQFGKVAVCGNGIIETTDPLYCAGGKTLFADNCSVLPKGAKAGEQCDPGVLSNVGQCDPNTCLWKPIAQTPTGTCGNGKIDQGEACDYATSTQMRGCSSFCRHMGSQSGNSTCGNGDIADGEDCDDGNLTSGDGCSSQCLHEGSSRSVVSVCGNAILEPGETCEKKTVGDATVPAGCSATTCLHTGSSVCDNNPGTTDANCCGNAAIESGEDCDDGNKNAGDGCSASCLLEGSSVAYGAPSFCSDGILGVGEQCEAATKGDSVVDNIQLAAIIGESEPDEEGLMSSKISAVLENKKGEATYGLQCGFTDESSCKEGYGLTDRGCCSIRPALDSSYPTGTGVCRNTQIKAVFRGAMNPSTVFANGQIAKEQATGSCPAGTTQVTEDFQPVKKGFVAWVDRAWDRLVAWWTGGPSYAAVWCAGSVKGNWTLSNATGSREFAFQLVDALEPATKYRVKFLGDKTGVKSAKGVAAVFDTSVQSGPLTFSFETGKDICTVNLVQVTDTSTEHPLLFLDSGEQHPFTASAVSLKEGAAVPIVPVSEYSWAWLPWTTSMADIVQVMDPQPNTSKATVRAENKNGTAFVVAWLKMTADAVSTQSTVNTTLHGTAPVTVLLCENPWDLFRDKKPTGDGSDSSLGGTIFENGPYFNFSTSYCRDDGAFGTADDLPDLKVNPVPPTTTDKLEGILRQYLFTYGDDVPALKKDGIGIRIAANPQHFSPEDWYTWRGFGGSPEKIEIEGYRALRDGTTTYIAAANTDGAGKDIYSNIYLISHNPDALPVTLGIYNQMVKNLAFNINFTQGVANVCEKGNNPNVEPAEPYLDQNNRTVACSNDFECLKLGDDFHCGSYKLKLARDTARVADFAAMSKALDEAHTRDGVYPKLTAGTFLQSFTNSRWPSWDADFSPAVAGPQPKDPVNQFLTCGRCSGSQSVCGVNADCPQGQTCTGVTFASGTFAASTSTEPLTCWDPASRKYFCPRIGASPSRVYQYQAVNGGKRFELASEFEVPPPSDPAEKWWSPPLMTEIKRCANSETQGFLCDVDEDCRPCPNPKDMGSCPLATYPKVNGSCRFVGGRFVYKDVCKNSFLGESGTCGDGVIGKACAGGSNNGNPCKQDTDCPGGGMCTSAEVCEIGQTQVTACTTSGGANGLKVQVCNECKEFLDDVNISTCDAGVSCGNGRVDKWCVTGMNMEKPCDSDAQCAGGTCGPSKETCDDGKLNGTYGHCNLSCNGYASYCGDSQISPGESCDKGAMNGAYCGLGCDLSQTCGITCKEKAPFCGDGLLTSPEQCDGQSETTTKGICLSGTGKDQPCSADADCGTGGMCASGASLLASCEGKTINRCATVLKQCVTPTYSTTSHNPSLFTTCLNDGGCSGEPGGKTSCRSLQDFVTSCTGDIQCGTSGTPGKCQAYPTAHIRTCNTGGADQCTFTGWSECTVVGFCGDGNIDATSEECDDGGNNGDTKQCTSACKKNVCGDGKPYVAVEECDAGLQNGKVTCSADYSSTCASCSTQCKFLTTAGGYCGDAKKNGPEQCDGMMSVTADTDQLTNCASTYAGIPSGAKSALCTALNADCMQSPCVKTKESGVTCQSLGYDFATTGLRPRIIALPNAVTQEENVCFHNIKSYEASAIRTCLGISCQQVTGPGGTPFADYTVPNPLPSANDFWKCVKEKGPSFGAGIETDPFPQLVQCSASCGFTGCGRCSDDIGTGAIKGQLVDAVYNQVVPYAKVSLFYKGVLIKQAASDADGNFEVTGLNNRSECTLYRMVVDKYDDNPCTGTENRPNCNKFKSPDWPYSTSIDEGSRGGYWPLTTPVFSVGTFVEQATQNGTVYLFPRPGTGEAYFTVLWGDDWSTNDYIWGGFNNHLVLPNAYAYTSPTNASTLNTNATTCDYDDRPAATSQCTRDVTWRTALKGNPDLSKLPYAQLICLHKAGDKVGGYSGSFGTTWNGCPVEGRTKCLASGKTTAECAKGAPFLTCDSDGVCTGPCDKEWWDTCDFYKDGPLTTYFRYATFTGATEPLRMFWNHWSRNLHGILNNDTPALKNHLVNREYRAIISTDKQIVEISGAGVTENCAGDCKFWHVGDINPTDATITVHNRLRKDRTVSQSTKGISTYQYHFQGTGTTKKYCVSGGTLYKWCETNADCPTGTGTCVNVTAKQWSQANY